MNLQVRLFGNCAIYLDPIVHHFLFSFCFTKWKHSLQFFFVTKFPQKRYHFDLAEMGGSPMSQVQVSSLPMEFCVVRNEDTLTGLCVS